MTLKQAIESIKEELRKARERKMKKPKIYEPKPVQEYTREPINESMF